MAGLAALEGAERPADLDDRLVATTGCNAAELGVLMRRSPSARLVARALEPFAPEAKGGIGALTAAVLEGGIAEAAELAAGLLGPAKRKSVPRSAPKKDDAA